MATDQELAQAEFELHKQRAIEAMRRAGISMTAQEGVWSGSHGGHDPDFAKLKGGLAAWWKKKVATDPHPFAYCVRHLRKRFANPERICAWLKDQAMGTTKWRKGRAKESVIDNWTPTIADLKAATECFEEAEREANAGKASPSAVQESASGSKREVVKIDLAPAGNLRYTYSDGTVESFEGGL